MNHLGPCSSYEEDERIDTVVVQHTIDMAGSHHVPVPSTLYSQIFFHTLHCVIFNNLYNQRWYFFCLLQIHES